MDYLKDLHETCETLSRELGEANKKIERAGGKMTAGDLDYIDKLTHAIKSVKTTIAMMEADGGESGYYMPNRMYGSSYRDSYRNSYRDGDSYRRDSMGRYSSRRSYDSGLADELHEIMDKAPDESVKRDIKRAIDKIERM